MILSPTPFLDQFEFPRLAGIFPRLRAFFALALLGLSVSGCGYNTIPTLEEQAKAKWADVQNNISGVPTSFPIWSRRCKAMPSRKRTC